MEARCGQCRVEEYDFDLARSYGLYAGKLRAAILQLKFRGRERLGRKLGELLVPPWQSVEEFRRAESPLLVPVPLHPSRQRERGFNQAALLTQGLSRRLRRDGAARVPRVDTRCLRRIRATAAQTGLSVQARHENVRGVFAVTSPEQVRDRVVVLVDDVMTTGATLSACARALKAAGPVRVLALTLARATPQFPSGVAPTPSIPVDDVGCDQR